jgi:PAS domain S-box-containing protein
VNQAFLRMWGFSSQDEVMGKHIAEFMEDPNAANELIELLKKGHFVVERTARKNDGSTFEAQLSISSVLDDSGSLVCMMSSFMDITDQKRTQALLEASEHRFRIGAQCASDDIYELDIPTNRVDHFGNIYQALGYPEDETPTSATAWSELIHPDDRDRVMESYTSCLAAEERRFEEEYRIRRKDGDFSYFIDRAFLLRDEHGAPCKWIGALTDITERKQSEESLYLEKEKLKSILDHMNDEIYIVDSNCNVQYVNPALRSERGDVAGRKCYEYLAGLAEACPWCKSPEVFAGESLSWERTSVTTGKTYEIFETPIRNEDGSTSKLLILHDITKRKTAEEELRQSEERFRSFIESAPDAIFVQTKGCFAYVNKATQELFGVDSPNSLLGTPVVEHFHAIDREAVKQRIRQLNVEKDAGAA